MRWCLAGAVVLASAGPSLHASGPDETVPSVAILESLEQKADAAPVRDRCFLYTELMHHLAEMEGAQLRDGDSDGASRTLAHIEALAQKLQVAQTRDSKRLKNAEELLEHTTHRLSDMAHVVGSEERVAVKSTLDHLNTLHEQMLALVFAR